MCPKLSHLELCIEMGKSNNHSEQKDSAISTIEMFFVFFIVLKSGQSDFVVDPAGLTQGPLELPRPDFDDI